MKGTKYKNRKQTTAYGVVDSKREARRLIKLKELEKLGEISDLKTQVSFELIPSQRGEDGKVVERACTYRADFVYIDSNGNMHVEDTKGFRTPDYIIKRKLMLKVHGIRIEEI